MKRSIIGTAASWALAASAHAVIVGGTNGDGFNNAGESTLQNFLVSASAPAFPYWNNLVRYSDASGVYLGYNPTTMEGWVISANHITETTTINVGGHTYNIIDPAPLDANQNGTRLVSGPVTTDVVLYKFSVGGANPIPSMPTVPIPTVTASLSEPLIMAGRGSRLGAGTVGEDTTAPYSWAIPGTSDAVPFRWGSNLVSGTQVLGDGVNYVITDFSTPGTSTSFDGQASNGDSGGGAFILRGGQWVLGGVLNSVADGPDADATANPAGYGDYSLFTNLGLYQADIIAITGTLVPEPSSLLLVSPALLLLLRRKR